MLVVFFTAVESRAQDPTLFGYPGKDKTQKGKTATPAGSPVKKATASKGAAPKPRLKEVLFITDAVCSLYVDEKYRGVVDVTKGKSLSLMPRRYKISAENMSGDFIDTVLVLDNEETFAIRFHYNRSFRDRGNDRTATDAPPTGNPATVAEAVVLPAAPPAPKFAEVTFSAEAAYAITLNDTLQFTIDKEASKNIRLAENLYRMKAVGKAGADVFDTTFLVSSDAAIALNIPLKETKQPEPVDPALLNSPVYQVAREIQGQMVPVKGAAFTMGSDIARVLKVKDELPEHTVKIRSLLFHKYEVTQAQWESVMGSNPSARVGCPACPVENVSWDEVQAFIARLNAVSGKKFRLPTEAEWEFVARLRILEDIQNAGTKRAFLQSLTWYEDNADKKTHPVGQKKPNASGIHDLFGNVAEWCSDWYDVGYYKNSAVENPQGPDTGKEKVVRGGSFTINELDFRATERDKRKPGTKSKEIGFRLVQESADQ